MKIERLPSGTYRVRKTVDKKTHSFYFDEKPTKREIDQAISEVFTRKNGKTVPVMSFRSAAVAYIASKELVLSPATVTEDNRKLNSVPDWFKKMDLETISFADFQKMISEYAANRAYNTVVGFYNFVNSVLVFYGIQFEQTIKLPMKIKHEPYCPTDEDVRRLLEMAQNTKYECAIGLAVCGLRRSEIVCVTAEDVRDSVVSINKALVRDKDGQWVVKSTKTTASTREVPIPRTLADKIKDQGRAYKGYPNSITTWINKSTKKMGIPMFSVHALRHYFASKLFYLGYSKREIEILGGWEKGSQALEMIYTQSMLANSAAGRKQIMDSFAQDLFA